MIKKYLKLFITLGIFITFGFSYTKGTVVGYVAQTNGYITSRLNNNYKNFIYTNGIFDTEYFGVSKKIFMSEKGNYFFFDKNTKPYLSYITPGMTPQNSWGGQGNVTDILLCDPFVGNTNETPQNCTRETYNNFSGYVSSVLSNVDYVGYGTYTIDTIASPNQKGYYICFSNEIKNLCFYGCNHSNCGRTSDQIGGVTVTNNLTNSKNYGLEIADIPDSAIGNYKYIPNNTPDTNNIILCPTIREVMQNMGENYNTGLCYNSTLYYNGTNIETIEKNDIFTEFNNNYDEYTNRINIYRNNCKVPATQQQCSNAFSGNFKKYSIIANAINSNVDEKRLRNYCNMGLNYDLNATTCVASGYNKEKYTNEEIIEAIINKDYKIIKPNSGTVYDNLNNNNENERDILGSIENIYNKITGMFRGRNGVNGIIPEYIMRLCYLTILFTILFKK